MESLWGITRLSNATVSPAIARTNKSISSLVTKEGLPATITTAEDGTFRSLTLLITLSQFDCDVSIKTNIQTGNNWTKVLTIPSYSSGSTLLVFQRPVCHHTGFFPDRYMAPLILYLAK